MAYPELQITSAALIERTIKEAVPRDWFYTLDVQVVGETIAVIRRRNEDLGIERRTPIVSDSPGYEIAPAVIKALLAPQKIYLIKFLEQLHSAARLESAWGIDIDSWAWQFYGDFLPRADGENDYDYKSRIRCILYCTECDPPQSFLPSPTEKGVIAWMNCFGYAVSIIPRTSAGTLVNGFYWASGSVLPPNGPTNPILHQPTAWNRPTISMMWNGIAVAITIPDSGEEGNKRALALLRMAKVYGLTVKVAFV